MEAMRTARLRLRRHERQLQMLHDPVHNGNLRDEGDDLHLAALMEPLTLLHEYCKAAALGAEHRVNLIDFSDHLGPALGGDALQVLLD